MKRYLLILLAWSSFAQTWSSLQSNQIPTWTNYQSSGLSLKSGQSHVTSNYCPTKAEILAKYEIDDSVLTLFSNNQLVPKANINAVTSYVVYISEGDCSVPASPDTRVYSTAITGDGSTYVPSVGDVFFLDAEMTIPIFDELNSDFRILAAGNELPYTFTYGTSIETVTSCSPSEWEFFRTMTPDDPCNTLYDVFQNTTDNKYYYESGGVFTLLTAITTEWYWFIGSSGGGVYRWQHDTISIASDSWTLGSEVNSTCFP